MLSINRTYFGIFLYTMLIQPFAPNTITFLDELGIMFLLVLIGLDMFVNGRVKRYKGFFVVVGILAAYAIYSMLFLNFNTKAAICNDFILQLKPFVPFFVTFSIAPEFTPRMRKILKAVAVSMSVFLVLIFVSGMTMKFLGHQFHLGTITMNMWLIYMYCSLDKNFKVSKKDIMVGMLMLLVGLLSTRSKFYGEFVLALYMLYIYRPGAFKNIKPMHIIAFSLAIVLMVYVAWDKISFYFIAGATEDAFDEETIHSLARPMLYVGLWMILMDFPLLGTGLASYATYSSTPDINYSSVYGMYDLDKVWGLSESKPDFICDAYFAELAQFGIVGIVLFVWFFVWIYSFLRVVLHKEGKYPFMLGVMIIIYVIIESTTGALFVQSGGLCPMMLLGVIIGKYNKLNSEQKKEIYKEPYYITE